MKKRNCPVCDSMEAKIIMSFTPELLTEVNKSYRPEVLKEAVKGKEEFITYSKCRNCSMVYCENVWDDNTLKKIYEDTIDHAIGEDAAVSIQKRMSMNRIWMNILRILRLLGKKKIEDFKIIDYGSGWGDFLDVVDVFGVSVIGYERDSMRIAFAKERGQRIVTDIDELKSFGPVDVIVMTSVLEHLQDVDDVLNLTKEILRPGGLFVFSVMDYRPRYLKKNINRLKKKLPALTKNLNPIEHVNIYDYKSVMATLDKYNYEFISTGYVLHLTDNLFMRNSMGFIKYLNWIEWLSTYFITWKDLSIAVYLLNK